MKTTIISSFTFFAEAKKKIIIIDSTNHQSVFKISILARKKFEKTAIFPKINPYLCTLFLESLL